MTNEERDLITRFIERVGGPAAGGGFASVPATGGSQNLPPIDRDADALLADLFQRHPEARYRVTQVAVVQEQALAQASQRIQAMQAELQRLQQGGAGTSPWTQGQQPQQQSRGFFGSLFGGGSAPPRPAVPPQGGYAPQPGYAPLQGMAGGMFQPQGHGFLGGALQTAAGVAGGVVAAEALTSLFSGGHGGGMFGSETSGPGFSGSEGPWGGGGFAGGPDPYDQGGAAKDAPVDQSAWAPAADTSSGQDSGWQDASSSSDDSGWTDSSGGGDSGWTDSSGDA